jgi:hypothetical protein
MLESVTTLARRPRTHSMLGSAASRRCGIRFLGMRNRWENPLTLVNPRTYHRSVLFINNGASDDGVPVRLLKQARENIQLERAGEQNE